MDTEDLVVDQTANGHVAVQLADICPYDLVAVFSDALVVESVISVDLEVLVVSSLENDLIWVLDLVTQQQLDRLDGVATSVDVVSEEDVLCVLYTSSEF